MNPVLETPKGSIRQAYSVIITEDYNEDGMLIETRFEVHPFDNKISPEDEACLSPPQASISA